MDECIIEGGEDTGYAEDEFPCEQTLARKIRNLI